jgi:hypothetical protein
VVRGGGEDVPSIPIPEVVTVDGLPDDVMLMVSGRIPIEIRSDGRVCIRVDDLRHVWAVRVSEPEPASEAVGSSAEWPREGRGVAPGAGGRYE